MKRPAFSVASFQHWDEASRAVEAPEDNGYSDVANPAVDELLARIVRADLEARLARRLEEQLAGDAVLDCAGLSPVACDIVITAIHDQLSGFPEDLSRQRADLRRKAAKLAPHNIVEIIGGGKSVYTDQAWQERDCLIYAYADALNELEHFNAYREELRQLLRETGFHDVARLRKQTDFLSYTDEDFDCLLERLADAGLDQIALKVDATRERQRKSVRGQAPMVSTEAKRKLIAKLEGLATSSNPNEAENAKRAAEEIKTKYDIASSESDPFEDFDLEALSAPVKLAPHAELLKELDAVWDMLKPLGDFYYGLENDPEQMKRRLMKRVDRLKTAIVHSQINSNNVQPTILRRRR